MFFDFTQYSYYLRVEATDMRCGSNSLAYLVRQQMNIDPLSKSMFLFCSKSRTILKVLVWDNGFWLLTKHVNKGTFRWPEGEEETLDVSLDDIRRLLTGQDVFRRLPSVKGKWVF
jgi:transposase